MSKHAWYREIKCECGESNVINVINARTENTRSYEKFYFNCRGCLDQIEIQRSIIPDDSIQIIRDITSQLKAQWPTGSGAHAAILVISELLSDFNSRLEKLETKNV